LINSFQKENSFLKVFIATPIDMLRANLVKFLANRKLVKLCAAYLIDKIKKIRLELQLLLLCGSCPKSTSASHRQCTQTAPDFTQIGSRLAELLPNAWKPPKCAVKWIQYSAEA